MPIEIQPSGDPRPGRGLVECMKDLAARAGFVVHGGAAECPLSPAVRALPASLVAEPPALLRALLARR